MPPLFSLAAVLAGTANVSAQTPGPAAPPTGKLDAYLASWEKTMAGVTTLSTVLIRVDTDKVFKTATKYTGWAAYMKSGTGLTALNKAILELKPEGRRTSARRSSAPAPTSTSTSPPARRSTSTRCRAARTAEVADNASLGLMFGMKAAAAKERFGLTLAKEDEHYVYVDVTPKKAEDRVEFQRARLVLDRKTFLPRQVWLEQPNGQRGAVGHAEQRRGDEARPAPLRQAEWSRAGRS